jgi:hypothetical protein
MTDIAVKGLDQLRATLTEFSDRRFAAAIATAMSRTAVQVRDKMRQEMVRTLDRPTPYTLNSLYTVPATADKLEAKVRFKDDRASSGGTPAAYFVAPNIYGGRRRQKTFEVFMRKAGMLPDGYLVVPGPGATLDNYGNMNRSQLSQILAQLAKDGMAGPRGSKDAKRMSAATRKAGGRYFVIPPGGKAAAGVYQRGYYEAGGGVTPVLFFVKSANYRKRFAFFEQGTAAAAAAINSEIERAVGEHIQRIAKKGGR